MMLSKSYSHAALFIERGKVISDWGHHLGTFLHKSISQTSGV